MISNVVYLVMSEEIKVNPGVLDSTTFVPFTLKAIKEISHNTKLYQLELADKDATQTFPLTSFVYVQMKGDDGKVVNRPYTPVRTDEKGVVNLVVKTYDSGTVSKYLNTKKVGETILMKGPLKKYPYQANSSSNVWMLAGGTGITPMLQLIEGILRLPDDKTLITLVFSNTTEDDILLRSEIDSLAAAHPDRLTVVYTVSRPKADSTWKGLTGRISQSMLEQIGLKADGKVRDLLDNPQYLPIPFPYFALSLPLLSSSFII